MQIKRQAVYGQYSIYGHINNVPVEVNTTVKKVTRNIDHDH